MSNSNSNSNFCKPFRELLKSIGNKTYYIRLGPKTYIVISEKRIDDFFRWSSVKVIDNETNIERYITSEELDIKWVKPNIKAVVNYAKTSQPMSKKLATMRQKAKREAREKYAHSWKGK